MDPISRQDVDLLIEARWIIPVEPANTTLEDHAVAIDGGKIIAVLPRGEARDRFNPKATRQLTSHALIPGLVNLHTHAAMTLFRGLADDLPLMDWLQNHIWPAEHEHVSPQFVRDGTRLACAEMLLSGTTCFSDMYFHPREAAEAVLASGMRAAIGLVVIDFPTRYATDADDYLSKGLDTWRALRDESLLTFTIAPHAPYTASNETFTRVIALAEQCKLPIHLHLHETHQEIIDSEAQFGVRPVERLSRLGLLDQNLIAAHGVHLDTREIAQLARHGASVAHCPASNLKLASGIAPLAKMDECGLNVGLGTDGAASNNRLDILAEMRLAALLAKGYSGKATAIPAHRALHMATLGGARALGIGDRIGSLLPGKSADICAIDMNELYLSPSYDPVSSITYAAGREHVTDVWVAGIPRVYKKQLIDNAEIELITLADLWQNQICRRSH